MRFLSFARLGEVPNIIVDGAAGPGTILTLSHWPKSGSPSALAADTSTEIVFNYLDRPEFHVNADAVSNNHFDEDGLVGIFAMLEPGMATRNRALLIEVAEAGDFGVFTNRHAARIAFALSACSDPETSPLPKQMFSRPYLELAGELYEGLLDILPRLLSDVNAYRSLWELEDARLTATEHLIDTNVVSIDERPDLDLAVIRMPEDVGSSRVPGFNESLEACHPYALHSRTRCSRLFLIQDSRCELQYRYEGWVQLASRRPQPRVDLGDLAHELTTEETSGGRWVFDGVDKITPRLHFKGDALPSISPDNVLRRVIQHLQTGKPAWNPYS